MIIRTHLLLETKGGFAKRLKLDLFRLRHKLNFHTFCFELNKRNQIPFCVGHEYKKAYTMYKESELSGRRVEVN